MTEEDRDVIRQSSPEDAVNDICDSLSLLLARDLTAWEKHTMSIKIKYWFMMGASRQIVLAEDKLNSLIQESRLIQESQPSYKTDYSRCAGEPE